MIGVIETQIVKIPLSQILLEDRTYSFHAKNEDLESTLKAELSMLGQLHPVTLQQQAEDQYIIIDGFRRVEAIATLQQIERHWEDVLAIVLPSQEFDLRRHLQIILDKNMKGEHAFGIHERALMLNGFAQKGLSTDDIMQASSLSETDYREYLELLEASPVLGQALNQLRISLRFAVALIRRYKKWRRTSHAEQADQVALTLLDHLKSEHMTLIGWNFLMDFYWHRERPFMTSHLGRR